MISDTFPLMKLLVRYVQELGENDNILCMASQQSYHCVFSNREVLEELS